MKKKFYNPEMNTSDIYEEVWIVEKINIKDEKNLLVKNHYWRDKFGELWLILTIQWKMFIEVLKHIEQEKAFYLQNKLKRFEIV